MSIYRSDEGRAVLMAHYERARRRLGPGVEALRVGTGHGETHVLVEGPEGAPPLVLLHGAGADGPGLLGMLRPLATTHRLYVPDLPGFPGLSAEERPDDDAWGPWVEDLLDGLSLPRASLLGMSWGGMVVLRTAAHIPQRIHRAALLNPAGMVRPSTGRALRTLAALAHYRFAPSPQRLARAVGPLLTDHDPERAQRIGAVVRHVRGLGLPRRATPAELAAFRSPTLVLSGSDDPWFPGHRVAARAPALLPGLVAAECLPGWAHAPSPAVLAVLHGRLQGFFVR